MTKIVTLGNDIPSWAPSIMRSGKALSGVATVLVDVLHPFDWHDNEARKWSNRSKRAPPTYNPKPE